jgi:hypothetical protein
MKTNQRQKIARCKLNTALRAPAEAYIWFSSMVYRILRFCDVPKLAPSRFFAGFIYNFVKDYNEISGPFKEKLFADLNSMKSADGKVSAVFCFSLCKA